MKANFNFSVFAASEKVAKSGNLFGASVDGNPANQLRLVVYPIVYRDLCITSGAGFLPSTVLL